MNYYFTLGTFRRSFLSQKEARQIGCQDAIRYDTQTPRRVYATVHRRRQHRFGELLRQATRSHVAHMYSCKESQLRRL